MRKIFLYGPPGSGKTTVGKILANNLKIPFLDVDHEIESVKGVPISKIIEDNGLADFREVESYMIESVCQNGSLEVIALGGGALLDNKNRHNCESSGDVVFLDSTYSFLIAHILEDELKRPLLAGNVEEQLLKLLNQRREHYDSFKIRVAIYETHDLTQEKSPEIVAQEIQQCLGRYHIRGLRPGCDVIVEEGGLRHLGEYIKNFDSKNNFAIVTDQNVAEHYARRVNSSLEKENVQANLIVIPAGEEHKTIETVSILWRGFLVGGLDRKSTVIALGGGVIGDLAGFAASTFMRGCQWVVLPTSLLSMVDASIGGKTGFDLPEGKNLIGSFHSPRLVLADPETLSTLPEAEFISGMAEVVKHGIIGDVKLFDYCGQGISFLKSNLSEIVRRAIGVKIRIVEQDPFESGMRASLNLGHTIGHALEVASRFQLRHGEAVAIGMVHEAKLAERMGIGERGVSSQIKETLQSVGLPTEIPGSLSRSTIIDAMRMDKKKEQSIVKFALPEKIGKVRIGVAVENLELVL